MKTLKNIWEETLFQEKLCNEHTDKHCRHKSLDLVMKGCGIEWIKKGRVGALFQIKNSSSMSTMRQQDEATLNKSKPFQAAMTPTIKAASPEQML